MHRTYTTDADVRDMVIEALGHDVEDFDVAAIVSELVAAADHDGSQFVGVPDGDDFWTIVARHDVSDQATDDAHNHLGAAETLHGELSILENHVAATRAARDDAIRSAIAGGVTMYAIARRVGITEQAVRRIRDRGK